MPTYEQLFQLYVDQDRSDREIGGKYGVSDVTISKWRRKLGVPTMTAAEKRKARDEFSIDDLDEVTLRKLYQEEHLTAPQIAERCGCSKFPVLRKIKDFGIPLVQKWERHGLQELSPDLLQVVQGTLLGDATIGFSALGGSSRLKLSHSHKQYGYLLRLHQRLGAWARPIRASVSLDEAGRRRIGYSFSTISHPGFRSLRLKFYRDDLRGEVPVTWLKAPPLEVFETLSDEGLAYWYFDDGTFTDTLSIVVFFPLLDIEDLADALRRGTHLPWTVSKGSQEHLFNLGLPAASWPDFFDRVVPYATPDLAYKFPSSRQPRILGDITVPAEVSPLSVERLDHYPVGKWKRLGPEEQEKWVREVFLIYRSTGFPFPPELPEKEILARVLSVEKHEEPAPEGHAFRRSGVGLSMCNGFMPHRYATKTQRGKSAWTTFNDDGAFLQVIRTQFASRSSKWVTPPHMRGALSIYGGNRTPANFRPSTAKAIVDALCPAGGTVWDPCAGFGGRLLGAVCSGTGVRYVGTEPSPDTVRGLRRLWETLSRLKAWDPSRVQILEGVAEEDHPPEDSVDLVFTSPPYFRTEKYQGGAQSHVAYPDYAQWREGFLGRLVENAYRCLKAGGHLCINIQKVKEGKKEYPLPRDLDTLACQRGFRRKHRWWYPLNRIGRQRPDEPILVYSKETKP